METTTIAAVLFAVAAVGGAAMAAMRLQGRELPPLWLALVHGVVAASGLGALIYSIAISATAPKSSLAAAAGFVVAALGGFVLFGFFHLKQKALPIPVMLVHATVAVVSFVVLLIGVFAI